MRLAKLATGQNAPYWLAKIQRNVERDKRQAEALELAGWRAVRVWEGDVLRNVDTQVAKIVDAVGARQRARSSTRTSRRTPSRANIELRNCVTANAYTRLANVALALVDAAGLEDVCTALESGRFGLDSTAPIRSAVAGGNPAVETQLIALQAAWSMLGPSFPAAALAVVLRSSASAGKQVQDLMPSIQMVWTGPSVDGSFLRATREVVREILRGAHQELLVVGYWIAARDDGEGIIEEVIESLADAVRRDVAVTVVLDERERYDGRNNHQILTEVWPMGVPLPRVLTWRLPSNDRHLKLHAKVLVADGHDALVTSANLTSYALDRNMEMGVRITGAPATTIAQHFRLLEMAGTVERF